MKKIKSVQLGVRSVYCCEHHLGMSFSQWHISEWHTWVQGMWISIFQGNSKLFPRHLYQFTCPPQCIRDPSDIHSLQPLKLSNFFTYANQTGKTVSPIVVFICIFLVTVQVKYLYFPMLCYTLADFFKGFTSHSVTSSQSQRKEHSHREKKNCLLAQYSWFFCRMDYDFTVMLCVTYWYAFQNVFF